MASDKTATVTGKPSGDTAAFTKCVQGGGKVSAKDNNDGTITETCTLGGTSFPGATKKKPATTTTTDTKSGSKPNPFQKAKADMETPQEQATAGVAFKKFEVTTDGTPKGTKVRVNGAEIPNLTSLYFGHYPGSSYEAVSLSYTTREPAAKAGELSTYTTYSLRCPCESAYASANASVEGSKAVVAGPTFHVAKGSVDPLAQKPQPRSPKDYAAAFSK
jgi:hypothetical protein